VILRKNNLPLEPWGQEQVLFIVRIKMRRDGGRGSFETAEQRPETEANRRRKRTASLLGEIGR